MHVQTYHVLPGAVNPLEVQLQTVVSRQAGVGTWTWVLWMSGQ